MIGAGLIILNVPPGATEYLALCGTLSGPVVADVLFWYNLRYSAV